MKHLLALLVPASLACAGWYASNPRIPGALGTATCSARGADGTLYVGGTLGAVGEAAGSGVFLLKDGIWRGTGRGLRCANSRKGNLAVAALIVDRQGRLYAGGTFDTAGSAAARNLALWDGATWSSVGGGVDSAVTALALDSNGFLLVSNSTGGTGIRRWKDGAWETLPNSPSCDALAVGPDGAIYAGGTFQGLGTGRANGFARLVDTGWIPVGGGASAQDVSGRRLGKLAVASDGAVWAGGTFDSGSTTGEYQIARWNGSRLSGVGLDIQSPVLALAPDAAGGMYVGGSFGADLRIHVPGITLPPWSGLPYVARCFGSNCQSLGSGTDTIVTMLGRADDGSVIAGGPFRLAGGLQVQGLARWDGTKWGRWADGLDSRIQAMLPDGNGWIVGGDFRITPGGDLAHVARFDGTNWSPLDRGLPGAVSALVRDRSGSILAMANSATGSSRLHRWNGSRWDTLGSSVKGTNCALVVDSSGTLWLKAAQLWSWDGSKWNLATGAPPGTLTAVVALPGGGILVGGSFQNSFGEALDNAYRFDGTTWSAAGFRTDVQIAALVADRSGGIVAFSTITDLSMQRGWEFQRFDGQAWTQIPPVPGQFTAYDGAIDGSGRIFAWGWGDSEGGGDDLWMRDSTGWTRLARVNSSSRIFADALHPGVRISGNFTTIGGIFSPWFAGWEPEGGLAVKTAPSLVPKALQRPPHRVDGRRETSGSGNLRWILLR